jgi:hypothetical protein
MTINTVEPSLYHQRVLSSALTARPFPAIVLSKKDSPEETSSFQQSAVAHTLGNLEINSNVQCEVPSHVSTT